MPPPELTLEQFMAAISGQESGGASDPTNVANQRTGAHGIFQILPENWPSWSAMAGIPGAPRTAENQYIVASRMMQDMYNRHGSWEDVASEWYSGKPLSAYSEAALNRKQGAGNEPSIREYVNQVMARTGGYYPRSAVAGASYTPPAPPLPPQAGPENWVANNQFTGGGYYTDPAGSGQIWSEGQGTWHTPDREMWIDHPGYSAGGGYYLDPIANQVWTPEFNWHTFNPDLYNQSLGDIAGFGNTQTAIPPQVPAAFNYQEPPNTYQAPVAPPQQPFDYQQPFNAPVAAPTPSAVQSDGTIWTDVPGYGAGQGYYQSPTQPNMGWTSEQGWHDISGIQGGIADLVNFQQQAPQQAPQPQIAALTGGSPSPSGMGSFGTNAVHTNVFNPNARLNPSEVQDARSGPVWEPPLAATAYANQWTAPTQFGQASGLDQNLFGDQGWSSFSGYAFGTDHLSRYARGTLPVSSGRITQVFGPTNEKLDSGGVNKGLDIGVPVGTPVQAVVSGTVVSVGDSKDGWGISVKIRDAEGNVHSYGHLSGVSVKKGAKVNAGQTIARSGNTGASTGPHLSYDVLGTGGQYIDPSPFLGFNAAGDNRSGSPAIGQDIGSIVGSALNAFGGTSKPEPKFSRVPTVPMPGAPTKRTGIAGQLDRINFGNKIKPTNKTDFVSPIGPYGNQDDFINMSGRRKDSPWAATNSSFSSSDKITINPRASLGLASRLAQGETFEDQHNSLMQMQIDLMSQFDELDPEDPEFDLKAEKLDLQLKMVTAAMDSMEKSRNMGLTATGIDAAKSFIETETGKQDLAANQYADFQTRVGDLTALGELSNQFASDTNDAFDKSNQWNLERFQGIQDYAVPRTTPMRISKLGPNNPNFNISDIVSGLRGSIPSQVPQAYNPDPAMYNALEEEVRKARLRRVLGGNATAVAGASLPGDTYNPMAPFGGY